MSSLIPVFIIVLALIAAGSIAYIAWELSSEEFHNSLEGRNDSDADS